MKFNLKIVAATAAVAMMSTGVAHAAAEITVDPAATYTYSKEGLTLTGTGGVALPAIKVTFGNSLTYQDDIYIKLPGVTALPVQNPLINLVECYAGPNNTLGAPSVGVVPFTVVNGGWNFRVTSVTGATIGDYCLFGDPDAIRGTTAAPLTVQAVTLAGATSLEYQANRFQTGQLVDADSSSTSIVVKSQFGISVQQALNAEIDVYANRLVFTADTAETIAPGGLPATPEVANDTLNFSTTIDGNGTTFTGPVVTVTDTDVTIDNGSFDWTDTALPAGVCFDSGLVGYGATGWTVTAASTCNSLVLDGPATATTNTGYFMVPGSIILSPADWAGKVKWAYYLDSTSNASTTELTWDPGVWTINGAQVYIQYMPYGEGISRIVYVANSGVINADGTVDVIANGTTTTCDLGAIASKTVTSLSTVVNACVAGAGIVTGKVALLMTFTAPDTDIEVYSAYNVGGNDRGTVVNTSNGRGLTYFSKVD